MDRNLRDDTLKLVRYKVLFVKREHEKAFPEQEDLVHENMDDAAFTGWKVAEFIQDHPNYIAEEDKKYLRVHYQVLERYSREKFKYEEDQIKVLEEIRDKIPEPIPPSDPFMDIRDHLQLSKDVFDKWRADFTRCADKLAADMAKILNDNRTITIKDGGTSILKPPEITVEELANALKSPKAPFTKETLDRFTGPALGDLRIYTAPDSPPEERRAPPVYSVWGPAREDGKGGWVQRITGAREYISPDDVPTIVKLLWEEKIDLTFNGWAEDLGFVSWAIFYQNHKNQLRSIGYEMNGKLLWINQLLTPDLKPLQGDVELASVGRKFIPENQFVVSVDYLQQSGGKTNFNVYAMHMNFDFKKCSAVLAGPILEMANLLEG